MAYRVERKVNGNIYLYETESYWDKEKKQPRQSKNYVQFGCFAVAPNAW